MITGVHRYFQVDKSLAVPESKYLRNLLHLPNSQLTVFYISSYWVFLVAFCSGHMIKPCRPLLSHTQLRKHATNPLQRCKNSDKKWHNFVRISLNTIVLHTFPAADCLPFWTIFKLFFWFPKSPWLEVTFFSSFGHFSLLKITKEMRERERKLLNGVHNKSKTYTTSQLWLCASIAFCRGSDKKPRCFFLVPTDLSKLHSYLKKRT